MAEALQIPVDFERRSEFRLLLNKLKEKLPQGQPVFERALEANAVFILMRLFVELALLAKSTNRPGYLTLDGRFLFESTLEPLFGDDVEPTQLLTDSKVLEKRSDNGMEEWFCPWFAQLNEHFASNFVTREKRGNLLSQLARSERNIAHEANQQTMLLNATVFKKRNGDDMDATEVQRCMVLIKRLDNCLKAPTRKTVEYSAGLLADACDVVERFGDRKEKLNEFYVFLMTKRDHPRIPKTTEGVLKEFDELLALAGAK